MPNGKKKKGHKMATHKRTRGTDVLKECSFKLKKTSKRNDK